MSLAQGVLGVVEDPHAQACALQSGDEGVQGAVAGGGQVLLLAAVDQGDGEGGVLVVTGGGQGGPAQLEAAPAAELGLGGGRGGQVLVGEDRPQAVAVDLAAVGVGVALDDAGELDLEAARQLELAGGAQQVGDPALAGLGVDAHDGLVGAAHVVGVDGQVGHGPGDGDLRLGVGQSLGLLGADLGVARGEALLDGVLVGAGEGGVDELTGVRGARGHVHAGGPLDGAADLVDVGQVEHGVHALAEEVEGQGHQVHVAGALAVAEQAALDAVGAGHEAELGGGHARAAVVVVVQGQAHRVAMRQVAAHPLDLVGVDVGGGPLDGGGQVEDDLAVLLGLPHVHDGLADLEAVVELGVDEELRGVLVAEDRVLIEDLLGAGHDLAGAVDGELANLVAVHTEDDVTEDGRQGVVEVNSGPRDADTGVQGAVDELATRLGEH